MTEYVNDVSTFMFEGLAYQGLNETYGRAKTEGPAAGFDGRVQGAYKHNGVIFACQVARMLLFTEARFMWQQLRAGRPQDLFWTTDLILFEQPWTNGSTGDLLGRMLQDVDIAGNAFVRRTTPTSGLQLERLRPDWTSIALGQSADHVNPQVVGYFYQPGGPGAEQDPVFFDRSEVAHWAPIPDPQNVYRGMSWLTPILREVRSDSAATDHKLMFWDHAATPNMVVKLDSQVTPEQFERFKALMDGEHRGVRNAYKTLYLGGGADATTVGLDFRQMDFKTVQGAGETRIAAAAGVPPVIVGLSEGLQAATYSNYAQARRRFADMTIRPLWRSAAAALQAVAPAPARSRLWYDDRDIPALQEDSKDAADIAAVQAATIVALTNGGFTPESATQAGITGDFSQLEHTGALSVQLMEPGTTPSQNGATPAPQDVPA
jgi:phage portal protein BeeE